MKKIILMTLFTALSLGSHAADYNYLVFTLSDGSTQSISASDLSITFSDDNLVATSGSSKVTIALTSLTKMEFSNSSTAVEAIEADVALDETTEIYDMNGRRMTNGSSLTRGIYIIKSNGKTKKITIK